METNEFKCQVCKEIFQKELTDEEARKQFKKEFLNHEERNDDELVCDDCFKKRVFGI